MRLTTKISFPGADAQRTGTGEFTATKKMRTKLERAGSLLMSAGAIFLAHTTQANIVYENATGDLNTTYNPGTFEIGDEITLAPGGGALTNFTFQYSALSIGGNGQAQLRFYENDGPLSTGFSSPGTMFF